MTQETSKFRSRRSDGAIFSGRVQSFGTWQWDHGRQFSARATAPHCVAPVGLWSSSGPSQTEWHLWFLTRVHVCHVCVGICVCVYMNARTYLSDRWMDGCMDAKMIDVCLYLPIYLSIYLKVSQCISMYVSISLYLNERAYGFVCICICIHMCKCMCISMRMHIRVCVCACICESVLRMRIGMHVYVSLCKCMHVSVCVCMCMYMYV